MAVADVLRPLDGAEAQFTRDGRRRLSTAPRESGRHEAGEAGAAARRERRRSHPPPAWWREAPTMHHSVPSMESSSRHRSQSLTVTVTVRPYTVTVTTENRLVVHAVLLTIVTAMVTVTTDFQYSFAINARPGSCVLSSGCGDDCDGSWELPPPCRSRGGGCGVAPCAGLPPPDACRSRAAPLKAAVCCRV